MELEDHDAAQPGDAPNRARQELLDAMEALSRLESTASKEEAVSFHIPLHRFISLAAKHYLLHPSSAEETGPLLEAPLGGHREVLESLIEKPFGLFSVVGEVQQGMWRRTVGALPDQVSC